MTSDWHIRPSKWRCPWIPSTGRRSTTSQCWRWGDRSSMWRDLVYILLRKWVRIYLNRSSTLVNEIIIISSYNFIEYYMRYYRLNIRAIFNINSLLQLVLWVRVKSLILFCIFCIFPPCSFAFISHGGFPGCLYLQPEVNEPVPESWRLERTTRSTSKDIWIDVGRRVMIFLLIVDSVLEEN